MFVLSSNWLRLVAELEFICFSVMTDDDADTLLILAGLRVALITISSRTIVSGDSSSAEAASGIISMSKKSKRDLFMICYP